MCSSCLAEIWWIAVPERFAELFLRVQFQDSPLFHLECHVTRRFTRVDVATYGDVLAMILQQ
jgi:hypothetical protein